MGRGSDKVNPEHFHWTVPGSILLLMRGRSWLSFGYVSTCNFDATVIWHFSCTKASRLFNPNLLQLEVQLATQPQPHFIAIHRFIIIYYIITLLLLRYYYYYCYWHCACALLLLLLLLLLLFIVLLFIILLLLCATYCLINI